MVLIPKIIIPRILIPTWDLSYDLSKHPRLIRGLVFPYYPPERLKEEVKQCDFEKGFVLGC